MRRMFLIGALALLLVGVGVYGWSRMHARGYSWLKQIGLFVEDSPADGGVPANKHEETPEDFGEAGL